MVYDKPIAVGRLVAAIADKAQANTQHYGRRPYGVGFLVIGVDDKGVHLYEFAPSGNAYEYFATSIGARAQSARTYLEKSYEKFADDVSLNDLIQHGLHALRDTLQQDKELSIYNTSIAHVGIDDPTAEFPTLEPLTIIEGEALKPHLDRMDSTSGTGGGPGGRDILAEADAADAAAGEGEAMDVEQ